jgi:hypothetical protein
MRPNAGVDYNLTLCLLQSRLQHTYHGQPYGRVDLNQFDFIPRQGLWIWPLSTSSKQKVQRRGSLSSLYEEFGIYSMKKIAGRSNMFLTRETTAS